MTTDPNWLLSTMVQSAAAFVAIVAGFIISKLLSLSAERSGLQYKMREIKLQLKIKQQDFVILEKELLDWDAKDFLEDSDVLDYIVENEGNLLLDKVLKGVIVNQRNVEELQPYWDDAIDFTKLAFPLIRQNISKIMDEVFDVDVMLKNLGLDISSYRLKICHRIISHLNSELERKRNPYQSIMSSISSIALPQIPDLSSQDEITRYRSLEENIGTLRREINGLETQLSDISDQLKQQGQPKGVTLGIVFLAYFSVTGIVVPIILLPFSSEQFTVFFKLIILILFLSGIIFFFIYLFILIRQLGDKNDSEDLH